MYNTSFDHRSTQVQRDTLDICMQYRLPGLPVTFDYVYLFHIDSLSNCQLLLPDGVSYSPYIPTFVDLACPNIMFSLYIHLLHDFSHRWTAVYLL